MDLPGFYVLISLAAAEQAAAVKQDRGRDELARILPRRGLGTRASAATASGTNSDHPRHHARAQQSGRDVVRNSGIEGIDVGKFLSQRAFRYHIFRAAQRGFLPAIRFLFTNEDGVSPKIRCLPKGCPSMPEGTISTILDAAEVNAAFGIAQDAEDYEVQYAEEMERRASAQRAAVKQAREPEPILLSA